MVATDDGSLGHHGLVTELIPAYEAWADQAFACGPYRMLEALARQAAGRRNGWGSRSSGGSVAAGSPSRSARPRRAGRHSSRSRWSRTWAAPWGRAWAAWSWGSRAAAARLPRGSGLRVRRGRLGLGVAPMAAERRVSPRRTRAPVRSGSRRSDEPAAIAAACPRRRSGRRPPGRALHVATRRNRASAAPAVVRRSRSTWPSTSAAG